LWALGPEANAAEVISSKEKMEFASVLTSEWRSCMKSSMYLA
jgi:hypothetical protein